MKLSKSLLKIRLTSLAHIISIKMYKITLKNIEEAEEKATQIINILDKLSLEQALEVIRLTKILLTQKSVIIASEPPE